MLRYGIESEMVKLYPCFYYYFYYVNFFHYYYCVEKKQQSPRFFKPCWSDVILLCSPLIYKYDLVLAIMFDRTSKIYCLIFH